MYTLFSIKIKKFFLFFLKVVTIGTRARIVVYQHLYAQICILEQDTIGYKIYNFIKNAQKARNTNNLRDART